MPWVLLVDEEALCKPSPEIIARDIVKVLVAGFLGSCLGGSFHSRSDTSLCEIDEWLARRDILDVLELL